MFTIVGDIMMHVGDITSTVGVFSTVGDIIFCNLSTVGDIMRAMGVFSTVEYSNNKRLCPLCKIYEMVLLSRLGKHAAEEGPFSDMQFGFKEGVGCTEASFTISETITC